MQTRHGALLPDRRPDTIDELCTHAPGHVEHGRQRWTPADMLVPVSSLVREFPHGLRLAAVLNHVELSTHTLSAMYRRPWTVDHGCSASSRRTRTRRLSIEADPARSSNLIPVCQRAILCLCAMESSSFMPGADRIRGGVCLPHTLDSLDEEQSHVLLLVDSVSSSLCRANIAHQRRRASVLWEGGTFLTATSPSMKYYDSQS